MANKHARGCNTLRLLQTRGHPARLALSSPSVVICAHSPPHENQELAIFHRVHPIPQSKCSSEGALEGKQSWAPQFTQLVQHRPPEARTDAAAARPRLDSLLSALLKRTLPVPVNESVSPGSETVSSGHLPPRESLYPACVRQSPPSGVMSSCFAVKSLDEEGKPYGAPSVLRRGKVGASLLKGQKPYIALRSFGQAQMVQMTSTTQEPSVRRSLHVAFSLL
ncbi:uncharacterized protein [Leuresthes tenuis]|uniref:uncharacterized protein n=1 Tax=Leuresthes tenuis TaxID=355514 RepID=UPI003B50EF0A